MVSISSLPNHNHHHSPLHHHPHVGAALAVPPKRHRRRRRSKKSNNPYQASSTDNVVLFIPMCLACLAIGWEILRLVRSLWQHPTMMHAASNGMPHHREHALESSWNYDQWCTPTANNNNRPNKKNDNKDQDLVWEPTLAPQAAVICQYFLPLDLQDFLPPDPFAPEIPLFMDIGELFDMDDEDISTSTDVQQADNQTNSNELRTNSTKSHHSQKKNTTSQKKKKEEETNEDRAITDDLDNHFDRLGNMIMNPAKALYPPTPKILMEARRNVSHTLALLQQQQSSPLTKSMTGSNNKTQPRAPQTTAMLQKQKQQQASKIKYHRNVNQRHDHFALLSRRGLGDSHYYNQDRAVLIEPYPALQTRKQKKRLKKNSKANHHQQILVDEINFFMGIFDGHGLSGHVKADYSATLLPKLLMDRLSKYQFAKATDAQIRRAIQQSFWEVHRQGPLIHDSGCTASIVVRFQQQLYFANTGDSRSFLIQIDPALYKEQEQNNKNHNNNHHVNITLTTRPHKPNDPMERQRIVSSGCIVIDPIPYHDPTARVAESLDGPGLALAMSRSIGDYDLENCGVIPEPTIQHVDLGKVQQDSNKNNLILLAVSVTDGMFDYVSLEEIAQGLAVPYLTRNSFLEPEASPLELAAEDLIRTASDRWLMNSTVLYPYRDDITIAVRRVQ